ncbi:MAG: archaemetzincin family Zn-dependent metalloprotease [bacterium]
MKYLYLKTIGDVKPSLLDNVLKTLDFLPVKLIKDANYPVFAFEPKRNQYYAKKIIEKMVMELPADCEKLVGITDIDLCTPVLTFVYGEAQLDGKVAVVSMKRLRQSFYSLPADNALLVKRLAKVIIHELGHCYGLVHCNDGRCVMYLSNNIVSIDNKNDNFCIRCEEFFNKEVRKENYGQK